MGAISHYRTLLGGRQVLFTFCFAGHFLACFWVAIGRAGDKAGKPNWLMYNTYVGNLQGLTYRDTSSGPRARSVYISAYYFVFTVMTSSCVFYVCVFLFVDAVVVVVVVVVVFFILFLIDDVTQV